jgi:hypothetical protein
MISSQNAILNKYAPTFCISNPVQGELLVYDSEKKAWVNSVAPDLDFESFVGLSDTPLNYSGAAGFLLAVDPTETAVTFIPELDGGTYGSGSPAPGAPTFTIDGTTIATFLSLVDTPSSYNGSGGFVLQVNNSETAVEFASFIDGGTY